MEGKPGLIKLFWGTGKRRFLSVLCQIETFQCFVLHIHTGVPQPRVFSLFDPKMYESLLSKKAKFCYHPDPLRNIMLAFHIKCLFPFVKCQKLKTLVSFAHLWKWSETSEFSVQLLDDTSVSQHRFASSFPDLQNFASATSTTPY